MPGKVISPEFQKSIFFVFQDEIFGRLDPYFYKPEFKELEEKLNNSKWEIKQLGKIADKITGGATPKLDKENSKYSNHENGIPFLRIQNIGEINLILEDVKYIKKEVHENELKRSQLNENDLVFTITGRLGSCALIPQNFIGNINQHSVKISLKNKNFTFSKFLAIYFNTNQGNQLSIRGATGGTRPALDYEEIKNLKIPIPPQDIQQKIISLMDSAYSLKKENEVEAKKLVDSIDDFVLEKLGITIPKLKNEMCFVVTLEELKNNRIDAEFHQEKYKQIERALERGKYELRAIKEMIDLEANENFIPDENKVYEYLDISNIDNEEFKILNYQKKLNKNLPNSSKKKIENGDFLFSKVRTYLKNICLFEEENDENKISTNAIFIFRKNKKLSSYLFCFFLTRLITKYLEKFDSGSTYPTIKDESILNLKIPLPPLDIQKEIADEVKQRLAKAKQLKKEASDNLNRAKKEVEEILLG